MNANELKDKLLTLDNQELEMRLVATAEYTPDVNKRFKLQLVADGNVLMEQFYE